MPGLGDERGGVDNGRALRKDKNVENVEFEDEDLARTLWPWLAERMAMTRERALELEAALGRGERCGTQVEWIGERTESIGWLVGCIAEALSGATRSPRRMTQGLPWMLEALESAALARGMSWDVEVVPGPSAGLTRAQTWECARALWWLARARPRQGVRVQSVGESWTIEGEGEIDPVGIAESGLTGAWSSAGERWRWSEAAGLTRD